MYITLSEAELAFRREVQNFLDEKLSQRLRDAARATPSVFVEPDIGHEWQGILREKGWLAHFWPKEYGGQGWTPIQRYIFERECALARAPKIAGMGLKLLGPVICEFGTDKQKSEILEKILSSKQIWCQGFSEPGAGSDLASLKTKAALDDDGNYRINGSKIWTTHAHHATHMFCLVRTNNETKPQAGISFLLIDMDQPGVTVRPIIGIAGDHEVNEVFLDNAVASADNLVGEEGQGWTIAKFLLQNERGGSCFAPAILAEIDRVKDFAASSPNGEGGYVSDNFDFSRSLALIELEAKALETTELRILSNLAKGRPPGPNTSIVKMVASSLRQKVDVAAMTVAGYAGIQLETARPLYSNTAAEPLTSKMAQLASPNYLNSRAWTIFGGTNEVQRTIIAKSALSM